MNYKELREAVPNGDKFFNMLDESNLLAAYSQSLGIVVEHCKWTDGDETIEVAYVGDADLSDRAAYYEEWTDDLLAEFDHSTYSLKDSHDCEIAVSVLLAIAGAPDWTDSPVD